MLISRLPDIVEIFFCTPDRAMDLTFQIKPIPSKFMLNLMENTCILTYLHICILAYLHTCILVYLYAYILA